MVVTVFVGSDGAGSFCAGSELTSGTLVSEGLAIEAALGPGPIRCSSPSSEPFTEPWWGTLKNLVVLAGVWGLFGLSQYSRSESGLMATVVAGIVVRASSIPEERRSLQRLRNASVIELVAMRLFVLR